MRIAFFGGSFDPPHRGHLAIATAAADRLQLDQVLIAPVGSQPLKAGAAMAPFEDRLAMARITFASDPRFCISTLDAPRADGVHNYTYETLKGLKDVLSEPGTAVSLFCLLGADAFRTLEHWHRAAELMLLCDFIIATRPGYEMRDIASRLPDGLRVTGEVTHKDCSVFEIEAGGQPKRKTRLYILCDLEEDVSATEVRRALAAGDISACEAMLVPGVTEYIRAHHLYSDFSHT